jgi:hypothetical protein
MYFFGFCFRLSAPNNGRIVNTGSNEVEVGRPFQVKNIARVSVQLLEIKPTYDSVVLRPENWFAF